MTAVIVAPQPKFGLVHVVTDAASYSPNTGEILYFGSKVYTAPHWPAAVAGAGSAAAQGWLAYELFNAFGTFDQAVEGAADLLPELLERWGTSLGAQIFLIGVSNERGPESYLFRINDDLPIVGTREELDENPYYPKMPAELIKLDGLLMTPVANDQVMPANYEGVDLDDEPEQVVWSLRKIVEMQRQTELPPGMCIGGFAQLTTISADGITQRILQRWPDKIGAQSPVEKIDWQQWHAQYPRPGARPASRLRVVS